MLASAHLAPVRGGRLAAVAVVKVPAAAADGGLFLEAIDVALTIPVLLELLLEALVHACVNLQTSLLLPQSAVRILFAGSTRSH